MATTEQVAALKVLLGDAAASFTDTQLGDMIDAAGSVNGAAAQGWNAYAAQTATMVNISESGSSRSMGDIHKNALTMAKYFQGLVDAPVDPTRSRTRPAVRP